MSEPEANPTPNAAANAGGPPGVAKFGRLPALAHVIRSIVLAERVGWIVALVFAALVALVLTDYVLRLPGWARMIWLLVGTLGTASLLWVRVRPVLAFRPSAEQLALLVEQTPGGREHGLPGVLASGVGLSQGGGLEKGARASAMSEPVVTKASSELGRMSIWKVINPRGAFAALGVVLACAVAGVSVLASAPTMTLIGVQRALIPWSTAQWPKREDLRDLTSVAIHPLGQALPLRAALVRGPAPEAADVTVRYRLVGKVATPWREVGAAYQGRLIDVPQRDELDTMRDPRGPLFERLLEPSALVADPARPSDVATLEYRFDSSEDRTEVVSIRLVPPPQIVRAEVTIAPPAYAKGLASRTLDAGPGTDERAAINGVLPGSMVTLTLGFNKSVLSPRAQPATRLGPDGANLLIEDGTIDVNNTSWALSWVQRGTVRVLPRPVDDAGLTVVGEPAYRVELREDKAPESVVTEPAQDSEALPTATLRLAGQSRDDVGLVWASLRAQVAASVPGSAGAVPEAKGEARELARVEATGLSADVSADLVLSDLKAEPGQVVWVTVLGKDGFEFDARTHPPASSPVRRIKIISADQMLEQLWGELAGVRRAAQRLSEQQGQLAERTVKGPDAAEAARKQPEISEQLLRAQEAIERVARRQRDNQLADTELGEVLRQSRELAESARQDTGAAAQAAQKSEEARQGGDKAEAERKRAEAGKAQASATSKLDQLAETLDRGQDTWAARRSVERLVKDQQALREQATRLGEETLGKTPEELTAEQRQKLSELADQQDQLAKRADEAFRKLDERAKQVAKTDPSAAAALEQAAQQGRKSGATDQMQQAARSVRRNQQQSAQQSQQKAQQALQQVLDQLRDQNKTRDAVLRRQLASLAEAIDALIERQTEQIDALDAAIAGADSARAVAALDGQQIRLNTATLAAAQQGREAGREARQVVRLIEEASAEQVAAITALRRKPEPDGTGAALAERAAKLKLEEAKAEAEKQQAQAQDREQRAQKDEIKRAYEALLVEQVAIRAEAQDVIGVELDRRARARARALGEREDALAAAMAKVPEQTAELRDATMFALAHERLDSAARQAGAALREDAVPASARTRMVTVERLLKQLIAALTDPEQDEKFRENEAGQQGGGGQQQGGPKPLIPPLTELRLLKSMQEEALALTREANEGRDASTEQDAIKLQETLVNKAGALLKAMEQQQGGGGIPLPAPARDKPAPDEAPKP